MSSFQQQDDDPGATSGNPALAHLMVARARKGTTGEIPVSTHQVNPIHGEQSE
jgi:hypothetical protein